MLKDRLPPAVTCLGRVVGLAALWSLPVVDLKGANPPGAQNRQVFSLIKDVPPLTLASWRLGTTTVLLAAAAAAQWRAMPRDDQRRTLQQVRVRFGAGGWPAAMPSDCCA